MTAAVELDILKFWGLIDEWNEDCGGKADDVDYLSTRGGEETHEDLVWTGNVINKKNIY